MPRTRRHALSAAALLASLATGARADPPTPTESANGAKILYLYGYIDADGDRSTETGYSGTAFHPMRLDNVSPTNANPNNTDFNRGMSGFKTALEDVGFNLTQQLDTATSLDAETLNQYDVLILGSNNRVFSDAERLAVRAWVHAGGGIVAWSDSAFGGQHNNAEVGIHNRTGAISDNSLTEQFGLQFLTDSGEDYSTGGKDADGVDSTQDDEGISQWTAPHYVNNHLTNGLLEGGVVFYGEGVSPIRVIDGEVADGIILAHLQNAPSNPPYVDDLDTHDDKQKNADNDYNPATDAAVAYATYGAGRVIGTFDRNTFWNNGEGTDLAEVDNRAYAQRLALWASGTGTVPEPGAAALTIGAALALLRRAQR